MLVDKIDLYLSVGKLKIIKRAIYGHILIKNLYIWLYNAILLSMKCIYCTGKKTEVINSRPIAKKTTVWRRRSCISCGKTFTTKENALADNLFVVKRNGKRERFIYEKLFISIFMAIRTKRNTDNGSNAKLAKKISEELIEAILHAPGQEKNITTSALIAATYLKLKKFGKLYADHYLYYSDFRLQVAMKDKLVK